MTHLVLIRHAHSDIGRPPRMCGTYDVPLSPRGVAQLQQAHDSPGLGSPPAALYSSHLQRATETAGALARVWKMDPVVDPHVGEINCGEFEGLPIEWVQRNHAAVWQRNAAQKDDGFTWPGGESYAQFRVRAVSALARIATAHRGTRVAVVTHAGVISQVLGLLSGRPAAVWEKDRPDHFSFTEVAWRDAAPQRLVAFNRRPVACRPCCAVLPRGRP